MDIAIHKFIGNGNADRYEMLGLPDATDDLLCILWYVQRWDGTYFNAIPCSEGIDSAPRRIYHN
jgi:hypothetical protein